MESKPHKQFLLNFLAAFFVSASAVAGFNYLVDPYGLFSSPRVQGFNVKKPKAGDRSRVVKPYQVLRVQPRTLVAGNSRPEMGIDPQSACWEPAQRPVYNLGTPGAGMYMQVRGIQHALSSGNVQILLISLDFLDFLVSDSGPEDISTWPRHTQDFEMRLAVDRHGNANPAYPIRRIGDYLIGLFSLNGLIDSVMTWDAQHNANSSTLRADGFNPARDYIDIIRFEGQHVLFSQKNAQVAASLSKPGEAIFQGTTQWSTAFESLRRLLRSAIAAGVQVTLFINPYHVDYLAAIDSSGRWDEFEQWKLTLLKLAEEVGGIPLWDFSQVNTFTTEAPPAKGNTGDTLRWFWEPAHYRAELGDMMMARMFGKDCSVYHPIKDMGVRLTPENVQTHLIQVRQAFVRFRASRTSK